ncbi:hypothetical protein [Neisseria sp. S1]|uniref:hypothetical protein n=1 Tax=Neisseria sp. S1 TaxID=3318354 RepID=UPI003A8417E2
MVSKVIISPCDVITSELAIGGKGLIGGVSPGIVTVGGKPARRKIVLIDKKTMKMRRYVWSAPNGTWKMTRLNPNLDFIVLALDYSKQYEPVAYDYVRPVVATDDGDGG